MSRSIIVALFCIASIHGLLPQPSHADDVEQLMATTFRITDGQTTGTGFVVRLDSEDGAEDELVFVTAGHALLQMPGEQCTVVMRTESEDGSFERLEVSVRLRTQAGPVWRKHDEIDVAVIPLSLPDNVHVSTIEMDQIMGDAEGSADELTIGQDCWVPCFPAGLESNPAGWPILRRGHIASYPLTPVSRHKSFIADCTTMGGDSGAAVFVGVNGETPPRVAGLVVGMHRFTTQLKTPLKEEIQHHPLGLAICVQAHYIRETIALLGE